MKPSRILSAAAVLFGLTAGTEGMRDTEVTPSVHTRVQPERTILQPLTKINKQALAAAMVTERASEPPVVSPEQRREDEYGSLAQNVLSQVEEDGFTGWKLVTTQNDGVTASHLMFSNADTMVVLSLPSKDWTPPSQVLAFDPGTRGILVEFYEPDKDAGFVRRSKILQWVKSDAEFVELMEETESEELADHSAGE